MVCCRLVLCLMFLISTALSAPFNRTNPSDSSSTSKIKESEEEDTELWRVKLEKSIEDNKGLNEIFKYFISYVSAHFSKSNQWDDLNCKTLRQEAQIKFVFHKLKGKIFPNKKPTYTTNTQPALGIRKYYEILPGNSKQSNDSFNTKLDSNKTIFQLSPRNILERNGTNLKIEKENSDVYKAEIKTYFPDNNSTTEVITVTDTKKIISVIDNKSNVNRTDFKNLQFTINSTDYFDYKTINNTGNYISLNENFMATIKSITLVRTETGNYQDYNVNSIDKTLDSQSSANITEKYALFRPKEISKSPQMITSTPVNKKIETETLNKFKNSNHGTSYTNNDKRNTEEAFTNEKETIQDAYIHYSSQLPNLTNYASFIINFMKYNNTVHSNFSLQDSSSTSSMFPESSELIKSQLPLITMESNLEDPLTEPNYLTNQNNMKSSTVPLNSSEFTASHEFLNKVSNGLQSNATFSTVDDTYVYTDLKSGITLQDTAPFTSNSTRDGHLRTINEPKLSVSGYKITGTETTIKPEHNLSKNIPSTTSSDFKEHVIIYNINNDKKWINSNRNNLSNNQYYSTYTSLSDSHKDKSITFPIIKNESYSYADHLTVTTPITGISFATSFSSNYLTNSTVKKLLNDDNSTLHKYFSNKTASILDLMNLVTTAYTATSPHPLLTGHLTPEATDLNDINDSELGMKTTKHGQQSHLHDNYTTTMVDEFDSINDQTQRNKVTIAHKISSDNSHNPNNSTLHENKTESILKIMSLLAANYTTSPYQTGTDSVNTKVVEQSSIMESSTVNDEMKITTNILPNSIYGKLKQSHGYKATTFGVKLNLTQDQTENIGSTILYNTASLDNFTHDTNNLLYSTTPSILNFTSNFIPYVFTPPFTDQLGMNSMTSGVVEIDDMVNITHNFKSSTIEPSIHNENESHTTFDYRLFDTITNLKLHSNNQKNDSVELSDRSTFPYSSIKHVYYSMTNKSSLQSDSYNHTFMQSPTTLSDHEKAPEKSSDDVTLSTSNINYSFSQRSSVFNNPKLSTKHIANKIFKPNSSTSNSSNSYLIMTHNIDRKIPSTPKSIDSNDEPFTKQEGITYPVDNNHSTYLPKIEFLSTLINSSETKFDASHDLKSNYTIEATKEISVLASKSTTDHNYKTSQLVSSLTGTHNIENNELYTALTESEGVTADNIVKVIDKFDSAGTENYSSIKQINSSTVSTSFIDDSTKKSSFLNELEPSSESFVINKQTPSIEEDRTEQTKYMTDFFRLSTQTEHSQHSFTPSTNNNNYNYLKTSKDSITESTGSKHLFSFDQKISGENSKMPYTSTYTALDTTFTLEPTNIHEVIEPGYVTSITSATNKNTNLAKNENPGTILMTDTTKSEYMVLHNVTSLYDNNTKSYDSVVNSSSNLSENFDSDYTTSREIYTIENVSTNSLVQITTSNIHDSNINMYTTPKYNYRLNETNIKDFKPTSNNLIYQQANFFSPIYYTSKITDINDKVATKTYSNIITEINYSPTTLTPNGNNNSSVTQWNMKNYFVKDYTSAIDQSNRTITVDYSIENKTENGQNVETNTQVYDITSYFTPYINNSKMFEVDFNIDSTTLNGVETVDKSNDTYYRKVTGNRNLTTDKITRGIVNTITTLNKLNENSNILTSTSAFHESSIKETLPDTATNKGTTKSIISKYLTESKLKDDESSTEHYETTTPGLNNFTFYLPTTDFHTSFLPLRIPPMIVFNEIK